MSQLKLTDLKHSTKLSGTMDPGRSTPDAATITRIACQPAPVQTTRLPFC